MSACSSWRIDTRHCLYIGRHVRIPGSDDCRRNTNQALFTSPDTQHSISDLDITAIISLRKQSPFIKGKGKGCRFV